MDYAVIYSSRTGNTGKLAESIKETLGEASCIYFGDISGADEQTLEKAQIIYAGFWTDKGDCDGEMAEWMKKLENKQVFLFGTAGFGGSQTYFDQILERVRKHLPSTAELAGTYMCQGKMPMAVRERYVKMKEEGNAPAQIDQMIENFDRAMSHPDSRDIHALQKLL